MFNDKIIWDEYYKDKIIDFSEELDGTLKMDTRPFHISLKSDVRADDSIKYEVDGKYISFQPISIGWSGSKLVSAKKSNSTKIKSSKAKYTDVFPGIDIENDIDDENFRKNVVINSLSTLGPIPEGSEFLEFIFKVNTDFEFDWWNKSNSFKFDYNLQLTDKCKIRAVDTHDSLEEKYNKNGTMISNHLIDRLSEGHFFEHKGSIYLMKRISTSFLQTAIFPVYTDITISYGSTYDYASSYNDLVKCAPLTSTTFLAIYSSQGINYIYARVATISGTTISYGSVYSILDSTGQSNGYTNISIDACTLSSTKVQIGFMTNASVGSTLAEISGTSITFNSIVPIWDLSSDFYYESRKISMCTQSSTTFIVLYISMEILYDGGPEQPFNYVIKGTVTGSTTSYTGVTSFSSTVKSTGNLTSISSTTFAILSFDAVNSISEFVIGNNSSSPITFGTPSTLNEYSSSNYLTTVDANTLLYADGYNKTLRILTISGSSISIGSAQSFTTSNTTNNIYLNKYDTNSFILIYGANTGTSRTVTISSGTISYGDESQFISGFFTSGNVCYLDSTTFVINFYPTTIHYGTAMIGSLVPPGKKINGVMFLKWNSKTISKWNG